MKKTILLIIGITLVALTIYLILSDKGEDCPFACIRPFVMDQYNR